MDITYIITILVIILFSMTIHEAMHAFTSYWLGDDTAKLEGRLTLNPIAHIDPFLTIILPIILAISGGPIFGGAKPVPFNPHRVRYGEFGAALVGVAGPLTNLVIAFVAFGILSLFATAGSGFSQVLQLTVLVNLGFFVFNMLPIPPLDGSRVLYAFSPDSVKGVFEMIERYGIFLIFAVVLLFSPFISSFMISGINLFVDIFTAIFSYQMV